MKTLQHRRVVARGFSLIELLMVVVILLILIGITTRVVVYVNTKTGIGKAVGEMERLKNALVEYHATFGIFPPVNRDVIANITVSPPQPRDETMVWVLTSTVPPVSLPDYGCYTGLSYYLWAAEIIERGRWDHYIKGMDSTGSYADSGFLGGWLYYTNGTKNCYDPWGRNYRYESYQPFQSFRLWSLGPDAADPADDIGINWSE